MQENKKKMPISTLFLLLLFWGLLIVMLYTAFSASKKTAFMALFPIFIALYYRFTHTDAFSNIPGMYKSPIFISIYDGRVGSVYDNPEPISGGRYKMTINFQKRYIPQQFFYRMSGWEGFRHTFNGIVSYDLIIDDIDKLQYLDQKMGPIEGAYIYWGTIDPNLESYARKNYWQEIAEERLNDLLKMRTLAIKGISMVKSMSKTDRETFDRHIDTMLRLIKGISDVGRERMPMPRRPLDND